MAQPNMQTAVAYLSTELKSPDLND